MGGLPQKQDEFRYFPGDPHLPNRIIIIDGSGSISFHVLAWLSQQEIPLIQLNWQGDTVCVANTNYSANPKLVAQQRNSLANGKAQQEFQNLIRLKFRNSILTLEMFPESTQRNAAIAFLKSAIGELAKKTPMTNDNLLGLEGQAAALYFAAWRGIPINWKMSKRDVIPNDWHKIGGRRSALSKSNRNARHPVNAMLNYAYAILHPQVKMQIIADGLDPTIGLSHIQRKYRDALVLDRMEPLRPIVDKAIFGMILKDELSAGDFTINQDGWCRLNPQLARKIVANTLVKLEV